MVFLVKMSKTKQHKALLYCSTEHATSRTPNGDSWKVNVGNTIYADKVDAISPMKVTIANLFNNVNQYNNTYTVVNNNGTVTVVLPPGQYTAADIATYTATLTPGALLSFSSFALIPDEQKFSWSNVSGGASTTISSPQPGFWELIGWDPSTMDTDTVPGEYALILGASPVTVTAPYLPSMGGEKLVHIACDKIAHGNLVHGADGKLHDIMLSVPLTDTAYGFTTSFVPQEDDSYMIDYRYTCSLASTLDFQILDSRLRPLVYPLNHHIQIIFKLYHHENRNV
jgi:hypothetical protein